MKNLFLFLLILMIYSCSDDPIVVNAMEEEDAIDLDLMMEIEDELNALIANNEVFEENILLVIDHEVVKGVKNNLGRFGVGSWGLGFRGSKMRSCFSSDEKLLEDEVKGEGWDQEVRGFEQHMLEESAVRVNWQAGKFEESGWVCSSCGDRNASSGACGCTVKSRRVHCST